MKIRHNPAGQRQIQEFFDSSRRMLHAPRQTCVKACSWDVSEVVPNKTPAAMGNLCGGG